MSRRHLAMLIALAAIWGSSFMFIKVAVRELEPGEVASGRVLVGAVALLPAIPFVLGYLVPALALVYGALFLDEAVTASSIGGLALILAGVALGTGSMRLPRRAPVGGTP